MSYDITTIDPSTLPAGPTRQLLEQAQSRARAEAESKTRSDGAKPNQRMELYTPPTEKQIADQALIRANGEVRQRSMQILKELHDRMPAEYLELVPILEDALKAADKLKAG